MHRTSLTSSWTSWSLRTSTPSTAVLVDENELMERDKAKQGGHSDGLYKSRRLIYVAQADFGPRPAIKSVLTLDRVAYRVRDCTAEAGILAIELEAAKT